MTPSQTGDLIVAVLTGLASVEHAATVLRLPPGQLFGWCDRVKATFSRDLDERPLWFSESGTVDVTHIADCNNPAASGDLVTFTVTLSNNTPTTLYGAHLIQRGFTNSSLDHLEYDIPWQRAEGSPDVLEPGARQRYVATYVLAVDDMAPGGEIVNSIAITGFTAAGQRFYAEQDATLEFTDPVWDEAPVPIRNIHAHRVS
ncbi:hypothetical protein GCM10027408_08310 [Microbacterium tumbae]